MVKASAATTRSVLRFARFLFLAGCCGTLLLAPANAATTYSCTSAGLAISCAGTFNTAEDVFLESFTLSGTESVELQTYGFGGGTNAAGSTIASGGFDSLIALFAGPETNATVLTDGSGDPITSSDALTLYSPGCPPAGTLTVGTVAGVCGDNQIVLGTLGPGIYTLLLADAAFIPLAVNPQIPGAFDLTDTSSGNYGSSTENGAYTDFTGGVFQTCVTLSDCNSDSGHFAVDISTSTNAPVPLPEPATFLISGVVLAVLLIRALHRKEPSSIRQNHA